MSPFIAEIIGTFLLILLGGGVVANVVLEKTKSNDTGWMVITTAWGLAVYVGVVVAAPYSGAHLNPAVSIGLAVAGKFEWALIPTYVLAQFIGAMLGALVVWLFYRDHFDATEDKDLKRVIFCTAPAIRNPVSNLFSEIVGTFVLVFVVLYFTDATISDTNSLIGLGSLGALPVAFLVWAIGLSLGGTTGYAINPARDLGPRIMHAILPIKNKGGNDWGYAWVPVVGPMIGAVIAGTLMLLLS
ncbi:MAG TPA: MIP/aquaporin family protein [Arenibacter sp.]|nr:MIP/aquaporin family protein [Arenibacter sp.]